MNLILSGEKGKKMDFLKLKEYREKANLSQREIAKLLGVSQPSYWEWESGKSFPTAARIKQICSILKSSPKEVFGMPGVLTLALDEYFPKKKKKAK